MKHYSYLLLSLLFAFNVKGQTFTLLDTSNSLIPTVSLHSIHYQDDSTIWLGSGKLGLILYNQKEFKILKKEETKIKGGYTREIFEDSRNNIWVCSYNPPGLNLYNGEEWISFSSADLKLSGASIYNIVEDRKGTIYAAGEYGLSSYDGTRWQKVNLPSVKYKRVDAIAIDSNQNLTIAMRTGLYTNQLGSWKKIEDDNSELNTYVKALKHKTNEILLVGHGGNRDGGLTIYNNSSFNNYNKSNSGLTNNMVRDIELDSDGKFWLATNDGINFLENDTIKGFYVRKGEYMSAISDISVSDNFVWFVTPHGLYKLKK